VPPGEPRRDLRPRGLIHALLNLATAKTPQACSAEQKSGAESLGKHNLASKKRRERVTASWKRKNMAESILALICMPLPTTPRLSPHKPPQHP